MHSYKKLISFITAFCVIFLSGCELKRTLDVTIEEAGLSMQEITEGEILKVENRQVDRDKVVRAFLGVSPDEAEKYIHPLYKGSFLYETDGLMLALGEESIKFTDDNEGAASCYSLVCYPNAAWVSDSLGSSLRKGWPEENLENVTREEVLAACQPYAEACGYGDADVQVYAMTLEGIEKASENMGGISAPGPGFEVVTYGQIKEAREAGDEEKADALREQMYSAARRGVAWQKQDEAFLVIYRPLINGVLMDSFSQRMTVIYVPRYERIIYAEAFVPFSCTGAAEKKTLISREKAVEETMLSVGAETAEDITITDISLVYSVKASQLAQDGTVSPCWRIDYDLKRGSEEAMHMDGGTTLIDAVDGHVSTYWK